MAVESTGVWDGATILIHRGAGVSRHAVLIRAHEDELKLVAALETGTPMSTSRLAMASDHFEYYGGWCDKLAGELVPTYRDPALDYVRFEPFGVVGAIITYNGPVINAAMKLAPALAAGNCVVLKSPELGPFATMRLAELIQEAGVPDGVVSVLAGGPEAGAALVNHPGVRKISFTGGPATAQTVMAAAAQTLKPVVLELGGKSANVVFHDADLDAAAKMAAFVSTIASAGQGCLSPTRLFVHTDVYEEMLERLEAVAKSPTIGDPLAPETHMGPVIDERAVERILGYVDEAVRATGARLITGGRRIEGDLRNGCFVEPTVVADVDNHSRLAREEVFGPVLAVSRFDSEDEVVAKANDSRYGLAAYVHTNDLRRAHRISEALEAGWVGVNAFPPLTASAPFGGTKMSGFGREGGRAGIEEYVQTKNVYVPITGGL